MAPPTVSHCEQCGKILGGATSIVVETSKAVHANCLQAYRRKTGWRPLAIGDEPTDPMHDEPDESAKRPKP